MWLQGDLLDWRMSPAEALMRWPSDQPVSMLHSGRQDRKWSRYSILARPDAAYVYSANPDGVGHSRWIQYPQDESVNTAPVLSPEGWAHRPLDDLATLLADRESLWTGYLSYDLGRFIEKLPDKARDDRRWPIAQMQRCPGWLVHDNQTDHWRACGTWRGGCSAGLIDLPSLSMQTRLFHAEPAVPRIDRQTHEANIARALDYIAAGDVFQVNLTQRFTSKCTGDPRALYQTLAETSPAWYGAYLELLTENNEPNRAIACTSPELFFSLDEDRHVVTRPIKGTRRASADPMELWDSAKDQAELTMIVDLLRNDLGRVCAYGSVRVPEPRTIETHPTIHHTTATVTGTLHPSKNLIDLIRAVMPGGSITGAPKVRAMQVIDELEPVRRGPYTGAIGFIQGDTACFNIAIRTMLCETDDIGDGRVDYAVGGGIVADSTPAGEYQESLDKAAAMVAALNTCRRDQPVHA
jgi:para-aminobenzoate synthetase component I